MSTPIAAIPSGVALIGIIIVQSSGPLWLRRLAYHFYLFLPTPHDPSRGLFILGIPVAVGAGHCACPVGIARYFRVLRTGQAQWPAPTICFPRERIDLDPQSTS